MESLWINISVCHFVHSHELLYWIINAELHPKFSGIAINKYYFHDIMDFPCHLHCLSTHLSVGFARLFRSFCIVFLSLIVLSILCFGMPVMYQCIRYQIKNSHNSRRLCRVRDQANEDTNADADVCVMQPSGLYDFILRFLNYFPLNTFNMT